MISGYRLRRRAIAATATKATTISPATAPPAAALASVHASADNNMRPATVIVNLIAENMLILSSGEL